MKMMTLSSTAASLALALLAPAPFAQAAGKTLEGQALADRYLSCWSQFTRQEWDAFAGCYAKDALATAPGLPDARGPKAILDTHARPFKVAMPDLVGEPQLTLVSGRHVASVALMRGTHTGPLQGPGGAIPATGRKVRQLVAHAIQSGGGSVAARQWFVQDSPTLLAQLGLSKAPARAAIDKAWASKPVVVATGSATEKKNLAAARQMYGTFASRDKAALAAAMADDVVDYNHSLPADIRGKAEVTRFVEGFWQMSSNVLLASTTMFAAGDYVVTIGSFKGTNDGDHPAMGIKKTGKKFDVAIIEITRWRDGKLTELWPFFDGMQLAGQLGLIPPPAATAQAK